MVRASVFAVLQHDREPAGCPRARRERTLRPIKLSDMRMEARGTKQWGVAWLALCLALAVHVADEAASDFLSLWNPWAESFRARVPWIPMPTFTFGVWLGGLIAGIVLLLLLSIFVLRGARWMRPVAYGFAAIMIGNGTVHIVASLYLGRAVPGVYSAPLLVASAAWLLLATRRCTQI